MSDIHAILFSNESFYQAFARGDIPLMEDIWSKSAPVSCAHPGWELIHGREAVMQSWHNILGTQKDPFAIEFYRPIAHFTGDLGYVTCYEILNDATLLATNIFIHENGIWKLVHHQAGPAPLPDEAEPDEANGGENIPTTMQ